MTNFNMSKIRLLFVFAFVGFFSACSMFSGNKIKIISISPDINEVLEAGDKLDISVTVKYKLRKDNGSVSLVIQKDDVGFVAGVIEPVKKGSGKITLKQSIIVPKTSVLSVYVPLAIEGKRKTDEVDSRVFQVQ